MLKQAYDLLQDEFDKCLHQVADNVFLKGYAREKYRHSLQVAGAGNYLLRHVQYFQNQSPEFIERVKTAILLHDIYRFKEITLLQQGIKNFDHGVEGGKFLQATELFNDMCICLPIRHHGHLIETLYADNEYQNISNITLQKAIQQICFIIRDADKIANLHMLANEPQILPLFLGKKEIDINLAVDGKISAITRQYAFKDQTIPRDFRATPADRIASYLSWYKDINYQSSIDFCHILNITPAMFRLLDRYCSDTDFKDKFIPHIKEYINAKTYLP